MYSAPMHRDDLVWLLASLCQIERLPFNAQLILKQYSAPHSLGQFVEAARELGFRVGESTSDMGDWRRLPLPAVALANDAAAQGGDEETDTQRSMRPLLIVKTDGKRALYFEPRVSEAHTVSIEELRDRIAPTILLIRYEASYTAPISDDVQRSSFGFRWIASELAKHRGVWRDVVLGSFILQIVGLATPLFTQVVIDKVVVHQSRSTLLAIVVGLVMFMIFGAALTWLRQYLILHTGNRVDAVLGSEVFRHLLNVPLPYFEQRSTGTLVARLNGVETIREFVTGAAICLILDLPFLLVFVVVMFAYSWELTLIAIGMIGIVGALTFIVAPMLRARLNHQFLLGARNQAFVTEHVAGIETVKSLQMEPRLRSRYDDLLANYLAAGFSARQVSNSYSVAANLLEQLMTVAVLCAGALLVMRNDGFTIGMLVAFQMFAGRLSQPVLRLAGLWQEFQQASIAVKRLGDIMNAPVERQTIRASGPSGQLAEVRVRSLAFRYSADRTPVLRHLSLTLKPGRLTVLTGPSGCGKSTLAKLLLAFYCPTEGEISIDGRNIAHLPANELRAHFGVVPQETCLFSGTIYENLIAANPNVAFPDVVHACRIAEIHEAIDKLPDGYNTLIGEHGIGLSGGQKQRLAIARALLKGPRILVFDEATSNLDASTAEQFARTVNQLKGKVTMLFIAHQIPKGLSVDEVLTLGNERHAAPQPEQERETSDR